MPFSSNAQRGRAAPHKRDEIMLIRDLQDCDEFVAGDNAILRELLHPGKTDIALRYSLAHAVVRPGDTTAPHSLNGSEVYYVLEGEGIMHIDEESRTVRAGQAVYIPPRAKQCITNTGAGDLTFLCIVDPAWRAEGEEVFEI